MKKFAELKKSFENILEKNVTCFCYEFSSGDEDKVPTTSASKQTTNVTFFSWIFEVQQTFSLKWLRQTLITTKKGRDYVSLKTSEKNLKVTLLNSI